MRPHTGLHAQIPAAPVTGRGRASPAAALGGGEGKGAQEGGGGDGGLGFRPPVALEEATRGGWWGVLHKMDCCSLFTR
jgi:hypothetical protein